MSYVIDPGNAFYPWLWRASWQGTVVALMVLACQRVFRNRLSPAWRYNLWWLVVLRLVLPWSPESGLSVFNLASVLRAPELSVRPASFSGPARPAGAPPEIAGIGLARSRVAGTAAIPPDAGPTRSRRPTAGAKGPALNWAHAAVVIWMSGAGLLSGAIVLLTWRLGRRVRRARPVADAAVLELLEHTKRMMGVRQHLVLAETREVASPCLHGFLRPRLLLPSGLVAQFTTEELGHIFLHELAHVKRRDIVANWAATGLQILHWFNPFVWLAFSRMRADREVACDALALARAGSRLGRTYGETVVRLLERFSRSAFFPGMAGILEGRQQMKHRIRMIVSFGRRKEWSALAVAVAGGLAICTFTDAPNRAADAVASAAKAPGGTNEMLLSIIEAGLERPITGVSLRVGFCNESGCFRLGDFTTGVNQPFSLPYPALGLTALNITATKEGYVGKLLSWHVENHGPVPGHYLMRLERAASIGGVVRDEAGRPISGVSVELRDSGMSMDGSVQEHFSLCDHYETTGPDGRWSCSHVPVDFGDKVSLAFNHPAYVPVQYVTDAADPNVLNPRLPVRELQGLAAVAKMAQGLVLAGRITDEEGRPIAGASVLRGARLYQRHPDVLTADEQGRFRFGNCPTGAVLLTIEAKGFAPQVRTVKLESTNATADFKLASGQVLAGRIVNALGNPIEGAEIRLESWLGHDTIEWSARTDASGAFRWDSAPSSPVEISAAKSGFEDLHRSLAAGDGEHILTLNAVPIAPREDVSWITGRVTDAATGRPVDKFRVTAHCYDGFQSFRWDEYSTVVGENGVYRIKPGVARPKCVVVRAEGYFPAVVDFATNTSCALQPGGVLRGRVELSDGQPAVGAQVGAGTGMGPAFLKGKGHLEPRQDGSSPIVLTDAEGRFELPVVWDIYSLVAAHDRGFAQVRMDEPTQGVVLRLQPWSRIEGQLRSGSQTGAHQPLGIGSLIAWDDNGEVNYQEDATTDGDGRFRFEKVPPGEFTLHRLIKINERSSGYSHLRSVVVQPGEAKQLTYGGDGVTVIGQMVATSDDYPIDWTASHHSLRPKREATPLPPIKSLADYRRWAGSVEHRRSARDNQYYTAVFQTNGAFRIEDVPPGRHELQVLLQLVDTEGIPQGSMIGALTREVVVPPSALSGPSHVLDLGTLAIHTKRNLKLNEPVPGWNAGGTDPTPLQLSNYRGQPLVLTLWASYNAGLRQHFDALSRLRLAVGPDRLAVVCLNMDWNANDARSFLKTNQLEGISAAVEVPAQAQSDLRCDLGIDHLPATFLIGPDGKLLAKDLASESIQAAVEKVLRRN
ncbi:MAG: M56 family metallopeptidase [Verrucomicrobiota bacterium]